jgi:hypothetical protein
MAIIRSLNAFLLILWSGGISYVRPFFPPQARKDRVPGDPGFPPQARKDRVPGDPGFPPQARKDRVPGDPGFGGMAASGSWFTPLARML